MCIVVDLVVYKWCEWGVHVCGVGVCLYANRCYSWSIEINSSKVRKVANYCRGDKDVVPYISFCTPTSRVQVQQYNFACLWFSVHLKHVLCSIHLVHKCSIHFCICAPTYSLWTIVEIVKTGFLITYLNLGSSVRKGLMSRMSWKPKELITYTSFYAPEN